MIKNKISYKGLLLDYKQRFNVTLPSSYKVYIKSYIDWWKKHYDTKYIKWCYWNPKHGIKYMMGIYGHASEEFGDMDDCFYVAGCIVMLQNHVFKEDKYMRLRIYLVCIALGIPLDKRMKRDLYKHLRDYYFRRNEYKFYQ